MALREGYTQAGSFLSVRTALGDDVLLLDALRGSEGLSELFAFTLTLRASSSALDAADLIGTAATVTLQRPGAAARTINGIVSRFTYLGTQGDFALYTADLVPRLWLAALGRDRVIYQNQTGPDIVKAVLGDFGVAFADQLTGSYAAREYCVRYDETAFDFISRLMEQEGIFYFFTFFGATHTLVLADDTSAWADLAGTPTLNISSEVTERRRTEEVTHFALESRLVPRSHQVDDYNYLTPGTALLAANDGQDGRGTDYEYPGRYLTVSDGAARARIHNEAHHAEAVLGRGSSHSHFLTAGGRFTLAGHPRAALNARHVVRRVSHQADREDYANHFETVPPATPFRAPRRTPHPVALGSHVATVVGPAGEEIWTDEHGRIKVQFPWDRLGKKDAQSSCWVRVSQIWAGQGWGALYIPRIGQEVVVSYVDGDPERPLVSGSVYNAEQTPPVALPGGSTQSTLLSRSTKQGTAGNELRFEDKKDSEELYLHAQKDMRVEVENDLATKVLAGNETHTVAKGDRTVAVETGKEVHTVQGTREVTVTGNETHTDKADFTRDVAGHYTLKVQGNLLIDVTGTVTIQSAQSVDVKAGTALTAKAGTNLVNDAGVKLTHKAGVSLASEAPTIDSKAQAMQTVDGGGMLALKGGLVKIN
ncbi:type VI secretion system tip protein TssI/VgrG [Xylophilus sp.]|uniref:type VI secretion system tip protein TssI/VgrG n=1 Tax=Xylophilus sp. TaxID=2653893 RepID=UPI0013BCA58F|nr:type VI secretion system tip protein TssI/VgrG [Xylophilus sp.]KAF1045355.1 MAG: Actin cross-linking toxin VgrG1 [Xylophilus sp.]